MAVCHPLSFPRAGAGKQVSPNTKCGPLRIGCSPLPGAGQGGMRCEAVAPLSRVRERDWGEEVAYFADPDGHVIAVARPLKQP